MTYSLPYKTKQFFLVLIKLSIVFGAFYFIYQKLSKNPELDFGVFINYLIKNDVFTLKNIIFLLLLTFLNWFFETLKWQTLVKSIKKITINKAFEQSLGALTASLFTPNRIGEYGAKAIYFTAKHRKRIVLINLLGNMLQMLTTIIFGIVGLSFFISQYHIDFDYYRLVQLILIAILMFTLIGFGVSKMNLNIRGFSFEKIKHFILNFPKKDAIVALLYSIIRYLIFSFQFYLILSILGLEITYLNAMLIISSMYLLASLLPSIFIFDVVIKGSVAVYLFSYLGINELTILSTILIMWLLNFVLPSLLGSLFVLNFNFPEDNESL